MGESSYCVYWTDYERRSDLNLWVSVLADDTRSETRLLQCHSRFRENDGINNLVYLCANHNFISDLFKRKKRLSLSRFLYYLTDQSVSSCAVFSCNNSSSSCAN